MCDFISWKEVDGQILFLTDKEVYSSRGLELFDDSKDNDVIGHGAINKYFGIDKKVGTEYEKRIFWDKNSDPKIPDVILEKLETVESFMKHWGKMFTSGCFQNDDLRYIIKYADEPYTQLAWKQLLKQNPSNDDLHYIIEYANEPYRSLAKNMLDERS